MPQLAPMIERLCAAAREAGRDPDDVPIMARGAVSLPGPAGCRLQRRLDSLRR
jgi:hypothetical protein